MDFPSLAALPFNLIDLLLAVVVALSLWRGWRTGFLLGALQLACLAAGTLAALFGTPPLAGLADRNAWLGEPWASPVAFLLIFAVAQFLLGAIVQAALRTVSMGRGTRAIDRALGLLPGAANGLINATVLAVALTALPLTDGISRATQDSVAVQALGEPVDWLERLLGPVFTPAIERGLRTVTEPPQPHQRLVLPFAVKTAPARPELEAAMLDLVNAERLQAGGRALVADPETVELARAHSRDMFARGYFAHETPEGLSPFDRLRAAHVGFRAAGENLALSPSLKTAHEGLMKSPGHRENILNPAFGRLGIGIVDGGRRGLMVTQVFRN